MKTLARRPRYFQIDLKISILSLEIARMRLLLQYSHFNKSAEAMAGNNFMKFYLLVDNNQF